MIRHLRNFQHLFRISRVLARYDALFFLDDLKAAPFLVKVAKTLSSRKIQGRRGERLAMALQALGPTFIKLGQALSTRSDLIGEEMASDLSLLQDRLPAFSAKEVQETIRREFHVLPDVLFKTFDMDPVAAASIAQVHFAEDHAGNEVAVKILRPGIERQFQRDIDFLHWVAALLDRAMPKLKRLKLLEVVDTFASSARVEMDLRFEAAAASELRENFESDPTFYVPGVYWQVTSRRVLTLERVSGIRIDDKEALLQAGYDVDKILQHASRIFFLQVFRDGFFHADMHPGNLFIGKKGQIIAMDFGIMGRVDARTQLFLAEMLKAFLERDYKKVSDVHFEAGYVPGHQSRDLFAQACRSIAEPIFGLQQDQISLGRLLGQLFKITEDFEMETQPQLLLLQKTMMLAEGMARHLNPSVNFWELARPLMEEWAQKQFGVEGKIQHFIGDVDKTRKRINNIIEAIDNIDKVVTKKGFNIHPDTLESLQQRGKGATLWKAYAVSVTVALLVLLAMQ